MFFQVRDSSLDVIFVGGSILLLFHDGGDPVDEGINEGGHVSVQLRMKRKLGPESICIFNLLDDDGDQALQGIQMIDA